MITYLDKILYLYPDIQQVMYWNTQRDGKPWQDLYEGIFWDNKKIAKPSKEELDAVTEEMILSRKKELEEQNIQTNTQKYPQKIDLVFDEVTRIKDECDCLKKQILETKINNDELKATLEDINYAFMACKGFLQEIPNIKKMLEVLVNNKKGNKNEK